MPERREGDWDCPDCGALVFASKDLCFLCSAGGKKDGDWDCPDCGVVVFAGKETCFNCDRLAGGGKGGKAGKTRREGDWDCPDCGALVFASKETCFKCDGAAKGGKGGKTRREGDWDCPDCGALVFASKETCFKCDRVAAKGVAGKGGGHRAVSAAGGAAGAAGAAAKTLTTSDAIKCLAKQSPSFKKAWVSYCKQNGQGFSSNPDKLDEAYFTKFLVYTGSLIEADIAKVSGVEDEAETTVAPQAPKRPAATAPSASEPAQKKKMLMKKSIADEIKRLNAAGGLLVQIRPGAVVGSLGQLEEAMALEALAALEAQQGDTEDPNGFLRDFAVEVMALNLAEA